MSRDEMMRLILAALVAMTIGGWGGSVMRDNSGNQFAVLRAQVVSNGQGIAEIRAYLNVLLTREGVSLP